MNFHIIKQEYREWVSTKIPYCPICHKAGLRRKGSKHYCLRCQNEVIPVIKTFKDKGIVNLGLIE